MPHRTECWSTRSLFCSLTLAVLQALAEAAPPSAQEKSGSSTASKIELAKLNTVIGGWRGVGQPRRGSNQGAWKETGEFVWDFSHPEPEIRYVVTGGQLNTEARISWSIEHQAYLLKLKTPQSVERSYEGKWDQDKLVFTCVEDEADVKQRLTITLLNDKRLLVLFEKTIAGGQAFSRVAEIGYTREGTRLAVSGGAARECVVTGGTGTIAVTYQNQTYYVCCSGCQQAFQDDPEGILKEYRKRIEARQAELNGGK